MKKIIIVFVFVLFLTGCSADYTIYIEKDKSVKEKFTIQSSNESFLELGNNIKTTIQSRYDSFEPALDYPIVDLKIFKKKDQSGMKGENKYQSIEQLNESPYFKNVNAKITLQEEEYTSLYITNNFDYFYYLEETEYDPISLDTIIAHIDIPFEVIETNADEVNGTVYTWNISDVEQFRTLYIKFNENKIVRKIVWDDKLIIAVVIGAILIGIGIFSLIGWYIIKKNNEM